MPSPVTDPPQPAPDAAPHARRAGVLMHLTSLGSAGPLGQAAYDFVDFLAAAGLQVWQVLPLVPTHPEDRSPYNALSAMAGNPELICRERQAAQGRSTVAGLSAADARDFQEWAERQPWLEPYAEFAAIRTLGKDRPWTTWEPGLRDRDPARVAAVLAPRPDLCETARLDQWVFDRQWAELRAYAAARGVAFFGDLPIFVSLDSADVWASRELFLLDAQGRPSEVTGVPPDYFARDGQRWNNPHYDWQRMATDDYAWWRARIGRQQEWFDLVRIDHFRGFESAWHVPAAALTARDGHWVPGPRDGVLRALVETTGEGVLVAEDLGLITPPVEALRRKFGLPGMKVLQFAFDGDAENPHLPEHHAEDFVVYTGTHDNDTTVGWWTELDAADRAAVRSHLIDPAEDLPWALIRLALSSPARLAVVPAQDLLGLGSEARMNTPGTEAGNWRWQAPVGAFDAGLAERIRAAVRAADRHPAG